MKSLRTYLIGVAAFLVALGLLLWFLPARWAMPWIEPHLHGVRVQQVHGSLWRGRSDQVLSSDGKFLGKARWLLSRRTLIGQPELQLSFDGPSLSLSGFARDLSEQKIEARAVTIVAMLDRLPLPAIPSLGQARGVLLVNVDRALLQAGWPLELQLAARWEQAAVQTRDGQVALGTLALQAQSHSGILQAHLFDAGDGPLAANGNLQLSPLGWRLDAVLSSRQTDPKLDRWLATLGRPSADGSVHIQQTGGLASTLPAPASKQDVTSP